MMFDHTPSVKDYRCSAILVSSIFCVVSIILALLCYQAYTVTLFGLAIVSIIIAVVCAILALRWHCIWRSLNQRAFDPFLTEYT